MAKIIIKDDKENKIDDYIEDILKEMAGDKIGDKWSDISKKIFDTINLKSKITSDEVFQILSELYYIKGYSTISVKKSCEELDLSKIKNIYWRISTVISTKESVEAIEYMSQYVTSCEYVGVEAVRDLDDLDHGFKHVEVTDLIINEEKLIFVFDVELDVSGY